MKNIYNAPNNHVMNKGVRLIVQPRPFVNHAIRRVFARNETKSAHDIALFADAHEAVPVGNLPAYQFSSERYPFTHCA